MTVRSSARSAALALVAAMLMTICVTNTASAYTTTGCRWLSANVKYQPVGVFPSGEAALMHAAGYAWASSTDVNGMNPTGGSMQAFRDNKGDNGYAGWTDWGCSLGYLTWADVTINPYITNSYSNTKKTATWLHEFGHGLGLNHSATTAAAMWYQIQNHTTPQPDDIAGMNSVY